MSDLPGVVNEPRPPEVVYRQPESGLTTVCHTLEADRGVSFERAVAILEAQSRPWAKHDGFRRSRREQARGAHLPQRAEIPL